MKQEPYDSPADFLIRNTGLTSRVCVDSKGNNNLQPRYAQNATGLHQEVFVGNLSQRFASACFVGVTGSDIDVQLEDVASLRLHQTAEYRHLRLYVYLEIVVVAQ